MVELEGKLIENSVPFGAVNYDQYDPKYLKNWGDYVDTRGEKEVVRKLITASEHNILIEGDKGTGKTQLIHTICREEKIPLFEMSCGSGMNKGDLIGRPQINEHGSYFELGYIPLAFSVANHFKRSVFYIDEPNVLDHEIQKWFNRPLDKRRSIWANGRLFQLDEGVKMSIVATINPVHYAGVNTLTEDLRSRFIGRVISYPTQAELGRIIDWTDIPIETVKNPLLTLVDEVHSLRMKHEVEYVLSPRDIDQFCSVFRSLQGDLEDTLESCFLIKFNDSTEREQVKLRMNEIFGVDI